MSGMELVPAGEHTLIVDEPDKSRAVLLMDSHDLEQAMAEVRGEVLASFVYVPKGAKPQLTYAGIKEAARLYRNVHFGATAVPLPDGTWMITSYAHNLADNTRVDYPMPYPAFDPANQEQAIKFRANLSKSLRNALAAVLPVAYLQTMIERWTQQRGGGTPAAVAERMPRRTPTPASASASERPPTPTVDASVVETTVRGAAHGRSRAQEREQQDEPHSGPPDGLHTPVLRTDADEPRSAADWTRAQLAAGIRRQVEGALESVEAWGALARAQGLPVPVRWGDMTQEWLLALYQAVRASAYAAAIPCAAREEDVTGLVAEALGDVDRRHITMEQYHSLREAGEARKAELASPLLAGSAQQVAS